MKRLAPHTRPLPQTGFTLVEIVVAVAVVAISVAAAFQIVSQAAFGTSRMQERTLASWIALNQIAEMRLLPTFPPIGLSDGDVEFGPGEWVWEAEVSATQVEALRRIEVAVKYDRESDPITTLVGFVSDPTVRLRSPPSPWTPTPAGGEAGPGQNGAPGQPGTQGDDILDLLQQQQPPPGISP